MSCFPDTRKTKVEGLCPRWAQVAALLVIAVAAYPARADWTFDTIPSSGGFYGWASMAIDAEGAPAVVYGDYTDHRLKYTRLVGGVWAEPVVVSTVAEPITCPSLVLDSHNRPHIAWYAGTGYHQKNLLYTRWTGTGWETSNVTPVSYYLVTLIPSLALTAGGEPRIAVYQHTDGGDTLEYAEWTGSSWLWTHLVGSGYGCCGQQPSLALDANDNPRVGWGDAGYFVYCWNDGAGWLSESLSTNVEPYSVSMVLDSEDRPHVVFAQAIGGYTGPLVYGRRMAAGWTFETIIAECGGGGYSRLALDAFDRPHVAYLYGGRLKYAHRTASSQLWVQYLDCGNVFGNCSIATDPNGSPHIAYAEGDAWPRAQANLLKYAHSSSFAPDPPLHDLIVNACQTAILSAGGAECGPPTYQWRKDSANLADGPTGNGSTISGATTATLTITNAQPADAGAYDVLVTNFRCPVTRGPAILTVAPTIPVASAGDDQSMPEGGLVTLDGSASSIPCGTPTFEWTQLAGTAVTLDLTNPIQPTFTAPLVPLGGETLTFQLIVCDGTSGSEPDAVNVTVTNVNHPPVALAGGDQIVAEGSPVTLNGSNTYDEDGDALAYTWTQLVGPMIPLYDADTATASFTAPQVGLGGETLTFKLTVSDTIDSATDTMSVLVENINHLPVADAGPNQTRAEGAAVTLDATGSSDPDADALTYVWTQVSGPTVMLADVTSPTPGLTAPQVGTGGVELVFRVTVDDGYGGAASDEVMITVQDTNSPPDCSLARPSVIELWPPNHKMIPVSILGVTDPDNNQIMITIVNVTQDESIDGLGDGDTAPDAVIQGGTVLLRAERSGTGNGRVYQVTFQADDGFGGMCTGRVNVCVLHSKGKHAPPCVDDGQNFGSLGP